MRDYVRKLLRRLVCFSALWAVLTAANPKAWGFGVPMILFVSLWQFGPQASSAWRFSFPQFLRFIPYFVYCSFLGSCDVAWRAVHRELPIQPSIREYAFRLPPTSPARVCFAGCITLLPGTLTADWVGDVLKVHVLTDGPESIQSLEELEERIGRLFGHKLPPVKGEKGS